MKEGRNPEISEEEVRTTEHDFGCEQGAISTKEDVLALKKLMGRGGDKKRNE